ncbi:hypothetical protein BHM03_00042818 [Ensete ventricosum]|nr:hypothetical protein BHM03_00042818 [Ensete ventricosum]
MESVSRPFPNPNLNIRTLSSSFPRGSFTVSRFPFDQWRNRPRLRAGRRPPVAAVAVANPRSDHDVVVVGAGIIGLAVARQLLLSSDLSVAVVDAAVPCSGATGAGEYAVLFLDDSFVDVFVGGKCAWFVCWWWRQGRGTFGWRTRRRVVRLGSWLREASSCGSSWQRVYETRVRTPQKYWVGRRQVSRS